MAESLFFYDLETSGLYPDVSRIMQFAGQRTDLQLNPIGPPINYLIRLTPDVMPDPNAILVHGISPQQAISDGLSEAEFLGQFYQEVVKPETTFVGFNNIRFDDEFIRYLNYRNLYDPYRWSYDRHNSRWDILDVVRLTRALRPEGINWPLDDKGNKANRLELLTKANKLVHDAAHDAYSDVMATIAVAKLIKTAQPKLYDYLFALRLKTAAANLVNSKQLFIYTSSHYPANQYHTTVVVKVADHPLPGCVLVYDLRFNPTPWLKMTAAELADAWRFKKDRKKDDLALPVKTLRLNRCPAIAPISVIKSADSQQRLGLDLTLIAKHELMLKDNHVNFAKELIGAVAILDQEQDLRYRKRSYGVDSRLYDGFYSDSDQRLLGELHINETASKIRDFREKFSDPRLRQLSALYLARNYPNDLTAEERSGWDDYLNRQLFDGGGNSRLAQYFQNIQQLITERRDSRSQILLEDLKLYGESLIPSDLSE